MSLTHAVSFGEPKGGYVRALGNDAGGVRMPFGNGENVHWMLRHVSGAVGTANDHCGGAVALPATIEQPEWIGNHSRIVVIFCG